MANGRRTGHFFYRYTRLTQKFQASPAVIFGRPSLSKINKSRRADSCEADGRIDSGSKGLLHLSAVSRLQPSLLGIRLMWLWAF